VQYSIQDHSAYDVRPRGASVLFAHAPDIHAEHSLCKEHPANLLIDKEDETAMIRTPGMLPFPGGSGINMKSTTGIIVGKYRWMNSVSRNKDQQERMIDVVEERQKI